MFVFGADNNSFCSQFVDVMAKSCETRGRGGTWGQHGGARGAELLIINLGFVPRAGGLRLELTGSDEGKGVLHATFDFFGSC